MLEKTAVLIDGEWLRSSKVAENLDDLLMSLQYHFGPDLREVIVAISKYDPALMRTFTQSAVKVIIGAGVSTDVTISIEWMRLIHDGYQHLVLLSGDKDLVQLLGEAERNGCRTTLLTIPGLVGSDLISEARNVLDLRELAAIAARENPAADEEIVNSVVGLIRPDERARAFSQMERLFRSARERILIFDNYVDTEVLALFLNVDPTVSISIVSARFNEGVRALARRYRRDGRDLHLYVTPDVHDRWFSVDRRWWHSGASVKDLGHRYSRIDEIASSSEVEDCLAMESQLVRDNHEVAV